MDTEPSKQEKRERLQLAEDCFRRGKSLFSEEKTLEAIEVWAAGASDNASAFIESQTIQSGLRKLRRDIAKRGDASRALEAHAKAILDSNPDAGHLHRFFSFILFEEGLALECYTPIAQLANARGRWRQEYEQLGEPPYARYRLALLDCAEGQLSEGIEGLRFCQDRFPPKKHESLRLKPLLEAAVRAQESVKAAHEGRLVIATPSAWEQAGFLTPFEARPWKRAGIPPEIAEDFKKAGFRAKNAGPWVRAGFSGELAKIWSTAGIENVAHAKRWHRAGVPAPSARPWEESFGGDIDLAVLFFKAGFEEPADAKAWSEHFQFPPDAVAWREQGFSAAEAGFWYHEAGVKDPYSAKRERAALTKQEDLTKQDDPSKPEE